MASALVVVVAQLPKAIVIRTAQLDEGVQRGSGHHEVTLYT